MGVVAAVRPVLVEAGAGLDGNLVDVGLGMQERCGGEKADEQARQDAVHSQFIEL